MIKNCLYLDEDIMMLEEPQALPLEGAFDYIAYYCYHPYDKDDVHTSPIQSWIEETCGMTCQSWQGFRDFHIAQVISCLFTHVPIEISVCLHMMLDIVLFSSMTKHKERRFDIDEMLRWLHWLYDFT